MSMAEGSAEIVEFLESLVEAVDNGDYKEISPGFMGIADQLAAELRDQLASVDITMQESRRELWAAVVALWIRAEECADIFAAYPVAEVTTAEFLHTCFHSMLSGFAQLLMTDVGELTDPLS